MKRTLIKSAIAVGMALAFAAGAHAQDAAQSSSSASSSASAPAEPAAAAPASEAAPAAPAVAKLNDVGPAPAGKGRIVFFRPSRYVGALVSFSVREGDTGIGKLTNGTYFVWDAEPGTHEYNISFEAKDTLRMEVEEGETYYVIQSVAMGVFAARPNLTPSTEDVFQQKALKVTTAHATDRHPSN